jgi:5-methylthioadenosine/S-adenosylhomocysteine deaminase
MYHPDSHIVYAASGADVRHVMVAGKPVVRDRRLLTISIHDVMEQVNAIAGEIKDRFRC